MISNKPLITHNPCIPGICPTALIVGSAFKHLTSYLVYGPLFGETWQRVMSFDKNSEFWASKETSPSVLYGVSMISSGIQTYAIAALLKLTGSMRYKSAFYIGSLIFTASSLPTIVAAYTLEKRPKEYVLVKTIVNLVETIGLSLILVSYASRFKL
ncbi:hypothetical protein PCANB_002527 [Pneumocystis canis]|nr:hypothetical protein PCK1_002448 [Pneumocystis canis]KAG5438807.1 hypothetical protein PCANB_002527 [Pneumocystis canis]